MINKNFKNITKGALSLEELKEIPGYPSEERFEKGAVAVIECVEEIPCNPCETTCSKKSIIVGNPITNLPRFVDEDLCTGCGNCIIKCPGLAIFVINKKFSDKEASIALPYEFLPLPEKGIKIIGLNRKGEEVCQGSVYKVLSNKAVNHTNVVTIIVPKQFADVVRFFKVLI